jgi:hypothetical protein
MECSGDWEDLQDRPARIIGSSRHILHKLDWWSIYQGIFWLPQLDLLTSAHGGAQVRISKQSQSAACEYADVLLKDRQS